MGSVKRYGIASISFLFMFINTLIWGFPIICLGVVKLIPIKALKKFCHYLADAFANGWIKCNTISQNILTDFTLTVVRQPDFDSKQWYMVIANHQSWVDIFVLQRLFYKKIPFLKFFLKKELLFMPVIGLAWWALDFPFMARYNAKKLKKNPRLRYKNFTAAANACEKFQYKPVSNMNFVEGTRFQASKKQENDFQHLLPPKSGGVALAISSLTPKLSQLLDVTLVYPHGRPTFFQLLSGDVQEVVLDIKAIPITKDLIGDYQQLDFRRHFNQWLRDVWLAKDQRIGAIMAQYGG